MSRPHPLPTLLLLAAGLSLSGCGDAGSPSAPPAQLGAARIVLGETLATYRPDIADSVALWGGYDIERWGDRIVVAELGQNRLSFFDFDLVHTGSFGTKGQGPGEFGLVLGAVVTPEGELGVIDTGNRRISVFDEAMRLTGQIPLSGPTQRDIATPGEGRFVLGVPKEAGGALVWIDRESTRVAGRDPEFTELYRPTAWLPGQNRIARLEVDGEITMLEPSGRVVSSHPLPAELRTAVLDNHAAMGEAWGPSVLSLNAAIRDVLVATEGGKLLVLTGIESNPLLAFDPLTGSWSAVDPGPDPTVRRRLTATRALAVLPFALAILADDDELSVVSMTER